MIIDCAYNCLNWCQYVLQWYALHMIWLSCDENVVTTSYMNCLGVRHGMMFWMSN